MEPRQAIEPRSRGATVLRRTVVQHLGVLLRYVSVGAASALCEYLLFTAFFRLFRLPLLGANLLAIAVVIVFGFIAHRNWTFRSKRRTRLQMVLYAFSITVGISLNNLLLYVLVTRWDVVPELAKPLQLAIVFCWNFTFTRFVVFADRKGN